MHDKVKPEIVHRASLFLGPSTTSAMVYGDANKAETSYFKIKLFFGFTFEGAARIVDREKETKSAAEVSKLMNTKYGWSRNHIISDTICIAANCLFLCLTSHSEEEGQ
jgi:hypothetical protein